jgi:hypothetical protein
MTKKALITLTVTVLFCGLLASSILATARIMAERPDVQQPEKVNGFNISPYPLMSNLASTDDGSRGIDGVPSAVDRGANRLRRPLGATSINVGEGVGESIDLTFSDIQSIHENGRQVAHWYNGLTGENTKVSVHFGYVKSGLTDQDTSVINGITQPNFSYTGYNVYDATLLGGDWPVGQDDGCALQFTDTAGSGSSASLDMMFNGMVVMGANIRTARYRPDQTSWRVYDGYIYYQGSEFNCVYSPYQPTNVTWVDSNLYRSQFLIGATQAEHDSVYLRNPQVVTQWDGTNTIVHLLAGEDSPTAVSIPEDPTANTYRAWIYFRKVGDVSDAGAWGDVHVIDSITFVNMMLAAADYPHEGLACVYTNPSPASIAFNKPDVDIWCRESYDRGLTWEDSYSITHFDNASEGSPDHGSGWIEAHCMFDSQGDLHAYYMSRTTSNNPYYDGFNWNDFDINLYHWEKTNGEGNPGEGYSVKVANGTFTNPDRLTGTMNTLHCGFGGTNSLYISWATMGECNGNLYLVWSQIHERANRFPWRNAPTQPAPGVLDDCSHAGNRLAMANWEILMSVAKLETSYLWDYPRNISNTYRPKCGLPGDQEAETICASEWKPQMEKRALDETGLTLYWPEASIVDMTPEGEPPYDGGWYLNMEYIDDQFPGPAYWGGSTGGIRYNPPPTWNSEKWVRLACVDPISASRIAVVPESIAWPEWAPLNTVEPQTVAVVNEGNVVLKITQIGTFGGSWLTASESPTTLDPFEVPAGPIHTDTFYININTAGISQPTWLNGYVWLKSDAVNADSLVIPVSILAADTVEPVVWDTVMTHPNMLSPFLAPAGACVALAVGNMGELGYGAGSDGRVGLDYQDASGGVMGVTRRECDTATGKIRIYLVSASPFVILADASNGTGAELTQSFNDYNQADEASFDPTPDKGSLSGGANAVKGYDSAYTGRFVNRDTTIAMERIVYGPRSSDPVNSTINFMIVYTKVYSADGQPHNHMTVGNVSDWDIPSDKYNHNQGGVSPAGFVYVQGTDTTGHDACAYNAGRFATEAFGGGYTSAEWLADTCTNNISYKSSHGVFQPLMIDTSLWGATPVSPPSPNPLAWWVTDSVSGLHIDPVVPDSGIDLALFLTYKHDYNLSATDTLHFWTVMTTTPRGGTLAELENQVSYAKNWYIGTVRGCNPSCCQGRVGNANGQGEYPDEITLGDIMLLVDVKFISGDCSKLTCIAECDVTQDGGANPTCEENVTLGDIMTLVDFLFITGPDVAVLKTCL